MKRTSEELRVEVLTGRALNAALDDVARLRIEVFHEWPYLYDGDPDYERRYLSSLASAPGAVVVAALRGERLVGAATGGPILSMGDEWSEALSETGLDMRDVFYCAESVLTAAERGQGLGHRFFDLREAQARKLGQGVTCFCTVIRPDDHPRRPEGYRSLEGFWRKRGYEPMPGITARYAWRDLDDEVETPKRLQFWMRRL